MRERSRSKRVRLIAFAAMFGTPGLVAGFLPGATEGRRPRRPRAGAAGQGGRGPRGNRKARPASLWPKTWKGPTTPTKAQRGKKVVVISCSQATACAQEVDGVVEGGKAIGWDMQVVDGKGDPSVYSASIRNAVTGGADGIVLASI